MEAEEIIRGLKRLRDTKNISQREVAGQLGISVGQYGHYETGHSQMTLATFLRILKILEIDVRDFFNAATINIDKKDLDTLIESLQELKTRI
jgi:transcriptional regulator with XRE-family HTH domain